MQSKLRKRDGSLVSITAKATPRTTTQAEKDAKVAADFQANLDKKTPKKSEPSSPDKK